MPTTITITEALADLKTTVKRIEKKREGLGPYIGRQDGLKDPLLAQGGSEKFLQGELQSIADLERRIIAIRLAIQDVNRTTTITLNQTTRSIAEWLTWRREIAPNRQANLVRIRGVIQTTRQQAQQKGWNVVGAAAVATTGNVQPTDYIINVDEKALLDEIEQMEKTLGDLDGQLSLKNATVLVTIAD